MSKAQQTEPKTAVTAVNEPPVEPAEPRRASTAEEWAAIQAKLAPKLITLPSGLVVEVTKPQLYMLSATGQIHPAVRRIIREKGPGVLRGESKLEADEWEIVVNYLTSLTVTSEPRVSLAKKAGTIQAKTMSAEDKMHILASVGLGM